MIEAGKKKTVFLWEIEKRKDQKDFWTQTLSAMYISMLRTYTSYIEAKEIPYYWNKNFNLIANIAPSTLCNMQNKLRNLINEIDRNMMDPYIGAKALLSKDEFEKLKQEIPFPTKYLKKLEVGTSASSVNVQVRSSSPKERPLTDCIDGIAEVGEESTKVLAALNRLQERMDSLTHTVNTVQMEQRISSVTLSAFMEKLESRLDSLDDKLHSLKDDGDLLKYKLNQSDVVSDLLVFDNLQPTAQYLNDGGPLL